MACISAWNTMVWSPRLKLCPLFEPHYAPQHQCLRTAYTNVAVGLAIRIESSFIHVNQHIKCKLIRSSKMQQYAGIYLLHNHSTTFLKRDRRSHLRKVVTQILCPVPEVAFTVLCTPDDGCDGHPKHVE
jgi:hypothetical protein